MTAGFFVRSLGMGAGLAMDACAVSMTDGLKEPKMRLSKVLLIAGAFSLFQAAMPIIGYFAGHAFISYIEPYIPWIALVILTLLGGKMIFDGAREISKKGKEKKSKETADGEPIQSVTEKETENAVKETAAIDGGAVRKTRRGLDFKTLIVQAIATSIDALSVGVSIADYTIAEAFVAAAIIAAVTFSLCVAAVYIGKKFGDRLGGAAVIAGGVILVEIGLEICLTGVL